MAEPKATEEEVVVLALEPKSEALIRLEIGLDRTTQIRDRIHRAMRREIARQSPVSVQARIVAVVDFILDEEYEQQSLWVRNQETKDEAMKP